MKTVEGETIGSTLQRWKKALVTKEDHLHHHKILGCLVLLSFVVRFGLQLVDNDMGFIAYPQYTIPTIAVHWMLTVSSLQFAIPARRIRDGARIWPQYRWHAVIFTTRSILLLALFWYEQTKDIATPNYDLSFAITFAAMVLADYVSYMVGDEFRSNTIRELDGPAFSKYMASTMQFNATAFLVLGIRSYAMVFYALFPIQLTPFVGTLRRKGVFTSNAGGTFIYVALLVGGFLVQAYQYDRAGGIRMHLFGRSIGLCAAVLRMTPLLPKFCWPLQNKFVIWAVLYLFVRKARPFIETMDVTVLSTILASLLVLQIISGYVKVTSGYYPRDVRAAKKMMAVKSS